MMHLLLNIHAEQTKVIRSHWSRNTGGKFKEQQILVCKRKNGWNAANAGICERFHKTIPQEFCQVTVREKNYESVEQLQAGLEERLDHYNTQRSQQGEICCRKTPHQIMIESKGIWKEKFMDRT